MPRVSCWRESWPQRDSRRALLRVMGLVDGGGVGGVGGGHFGWGWRFGGSGKERVAEVNTWGEWGLYVSCIGLFGSACFVNQAGAKISCVELLLFVSQSL